MKGDDAAIIAKQYVYLLHDSCSESKVLLWRGVGATFTSRQV